VTKSNRAAPRGLHPESVNDLLQADPARASLADGISAHSLRAGFVTYAHLRGASDPAIAHQTPAPLAGRPRGPGRPVSPGYMGPGNDRFQDPCSRERGCG
jgi:hypothetical protein